MPTILQGSVMGCNNDPSQTNIDAAYGLGLRIMRWSDEWPWQQPTSNPASLDTSETAASIARVHAKPGMGCMFVFLGVPPWVNSNANGGVAGYHRFPTDAAKRTLAANACVSYARLLDPARDFLQINNEMNNTAFQAFNEDAQSAAVVAAYLVACIAAVKAACPGLRIVTGGLATLGDVNYAPDNFTQPKFGAAMLAAEPSLAGANAPWGWGTHTYTYSNGKNAGFDRSWLTSGQVASLADGTTVRGGDPVPVVSPLSIKGWNGRQHLIGYWYALVVAGVVSPRMVITEHGCPWTGPVAGVYDEAWQDHHYCEDFWAMDNDWLAGVTGGAQIMHTLFPNPYDGALDMSVLRADGSRRPAGQRIADRAARALAGTAPGTPPTAGFTWAAGAANLIRFTNTSVGQTGNLWDFGDGSSPTYTVEPTHTYPGPGSYTVKLTAANADGSSVATRSVTVATDGGGNPTPASGPGPVAVPGAVPTWGLRMGLHIDAPVIGDVAFISGLGLHHVRVPVTLGADLAPLAAFIAQAHSVAMGVVVRVSDVAGGYVNWTDPNFAVYGDFCKRIADLGVTAVQAGHSLSDPAVNGALAADSTSAHWKLSARLALAAAAAIRPTHPACRVLAAGVIPYVSGPDDRKPYDCHELVGLAYGGALHAAGVRPAWNPYEYGDPTVGTFDHAANPCGWLTFAQVRQYALGWRRRLWITELGWDARLASGLSLSAKEDQQATQVGLYQSALAAQRVAGLRLDRVFFSTLRDTGSTDATRLGLYRVDGTVKPSAAALRSWALTPW